jgi:hypothetical protein
MPVMGAHHESLDKLTPADVWNGRGEEILAERGRIKLQTIAKRRCSINCKPHNL